MTPQVFVECDAAQIEGKIQFMLTRDPEMIRLARLRPSELDMHTRNTAYIFEADESALRAELDSKDSAVRKAAKEKRHLGKTTGYMAQRGGGAKRYAEVLLLEGIVRTVDECQRYLNRYMDLYAPLDDYFADCRRVVSQSRTLVNTWGDVWRCQYDRFDEVLWGKVYSWLPQSECARQMNHWGFEPLFRWLAAERPWAHINLPVHDSLLVSCRPDDAYDVANFVRRTFERPRVYFNEPLVVPVTFKLGSSWACEREWDELPTREEFTTAAYECQRKALEAWEAA